MTHEHLAVHRCAWSNLCFTMGWASFLNISPSATKDEIWRPNLRPCRNYTQILLHNRDGILHNVHHFRFFALSFIITVTPFSLLPVLFFVFIAFFAIALIVCQYTDHSRGIVDLKVQRRLQTVVKQGELLKVYIATHNTCSLHVNVAILRIEAIGRSFEAGYQQPKYSSFPKSIATPKSCQGVPIA